MGARRTLIWQIDSPRESEPAVDAVYKLLHNYVPISVWTHAKRAPTEQNVILDILDDGVSILSGRQATVNVMQVEGDGLIGSAVTVLLKGSLITCSVVQGDHSVGDVTLGLELEEE